MAWIIENWTDLFFIITSIISVASVVAKLTPTETDDKILANFLKIIDLLAINNKPTELKK